jgi:hypothetical protein
MEVIAFDRLEVQQQRCAYARLQVDRLQLNGDDDTVSAPDAAKKPLLTVLDQLDPRAARLTSVRT